MAVKILIGDVRDRLKDLSDESVHCVVTSPPYFGLRDYGVAGQIGLESSPDEFVQTLVEVFREVRRVLRSDGTLWLNLGDSYAGSGRGGNPTEATSTLEGGQQSQRASMVSRTRGSQLAAGFHESARRAAAIGRAWVPPPSGLKQKDLIGAPWRVAFALQADGWWLRQDIIWHKPNPMPESIRDRCTKAHEYMFLLSKSERYFFDHAAMKEPATQAGRVRADRMGGNKYGEGVKHSDGSIFTGSDTRNRRSVWTVTTKPFKGAHFATFPPALVEPCILAGCPKGGMVLDPFGGSGTTGLVADRLQRNAILIELNPAYAAMAMRRIDDDAGMFREAAE